MGSTYSSLSHDIEEVIHPSREEFSARFREIEAADTSKLNAQTLQENGKDVRHQNDEEQPEPVRSTSSYIGRVISRIDVSHRNLQYHDQ